MSFVELPSQSASGLLLRSAPMLAGAYIDRRDPSLCGVPPAPGHGGSFARNRGGGFGDRLGGGSRGGGADADAGAVGGGGRLGAGGGMGVSARRLEVGSIGCGDVDGYDSAVDDGAEEDAWFAQHEAEDDAACRCCSGQRGVGASLREWCPRLGGGGVDGPGGGHVRARSGSGLAMLFLGQQVSVAGTSARGSCSQRCGLFGKQASRLPSCT